MARLCLLLALLLASAWAPASRAGECADLPRRLLAPFRVPDYLDTHSPTRTWRRAHFSPACQGLNLCYSRLGAERRLCEEELAREMDQICRRSYDGAYEEAARRRCLLAVGNWMEDLAANRGRAFRDAQYEARWFEGGGKRRVDRPRRKWLTEESPPEDPTTGDPRRGAGPGAP